MWSICRFFAFYPSQLVFSKVDILNLAALSCCQVGFWGFGITFLKGFQVYESNEMSWLRGDD